MQTGTEAPRNDPGPLYDFEIDIPTVKSGDAYPHFKNFIVGFADEGGRGVSFTKFFVEKLELTPLADIYLNKPHVFKSVHVINGAIHSLFRLYGHGDTMIGQIDMPYDSKLDAVFSEVLLTIYSKFQCQALVFLNSAPQDMEAYIPEHLKELFLSKKIAPYQLEELALQQVQREPTDEDRKFLYFTNSDALRERIEGAFPKRSTLLQNGILGSVVGMMFHKARNTAAGVNIVVMTTKFNPARIDPEPVMNMVDFVQVLSESGFELDTSVLREESASYLQEVGGKMSHKVDANRHSGGMMYT